MISHTDSACSKPHSHVSWYRAGNFGTLQKQAAFWAWAGPIAVYRSFQSSVLLDKTTRNYPCIHVHVYRARIVCVVLLSTLDSSVRLASVFSYPETETNSLAFLKSGIKKLYTPPGVNINTSCLKARFALILLFIPKKTQLSLYIKIVCTLSFTTKCWYIFEISRSIYLKLRHVQSVEQTKAG